MKIFPELDLLKSGSRIFLLFAVFNLITATSSFCDPVYRSTDSRGVVHYSSKKTDKAAEPAQLPSIEKAHFGEVKVNNMTCAGHGGINCQAGADTDGSVVCYDSFKGSMQRFAFSCSAAKLIIIPQSQKIKAGEFSLVVRNTSAVPAKGIKVSAPDNLILEGPAELEPYGSAQYVSRQVQDKKVNFQITCENCP